MPIFEIRERNNLHLSVEHMAPPQGCSQKSAWLRCELPFSLEDATQTARRILGYTNAPFDETDVARIVQKLFILQPFAKLYQDRDLTQPSALSWLGAQQEKTLDDALKYLAKFHPSLALEAFAPSTQDLVAHKEEIAHLKQGAKQAWQMYESEKKRANALADQSEEIAHLKRRLKIAEEQLRQRESRVAAQAEEIESLNRKLKIADHQINSGKSEIKALEGRLSNYARRYGDQF